MARTAHKISRLLLAALLVAAGTAMLVLPGPGLVAMAVGLGIAGRELGWTWVLRAEARLHGFSASLRSRLGFGGLLTS